MNIQHLRYAVEVERVGSITVAAENLYISQPSLSKAIRDLESGLGFPVFERTPRGVFPTSRGREFLLHAYAILNQMSEIEALSSIGEVDGQKLKLAMPCAGYLFEAAARLCARLNAQKPMEVRCVTHSTLDTLESVESGAARLGIIRYPAVEDAYMQNQLDKKKLKSEVIWTFAPVALTAREGEIAQMSDERLSALSSFIRIFQEEKEPLKDASQEESSRIKSVYAADLSLQLTLLSTVPGTYMLSSPMPKALLDRYGLIEKKTDGESLCDRLIYLSSGRFSPCERAFVEQLFAVKNEIALPFE